ncbi:hypothetical protein GCM10010869_28150 [Mesorhizobium tianshanense]|nr:hypothetical protein GCM10010869_28150 [Mesorhizobium tianshanense]
MAQNSAQPAPSVKVLWGLVEYTKDGVSEPRSKGVLPDAPKAEPLVVESPKAEPAKIEKPVAEVLAEPKAMTAKAETPKAELKPNEPAIAIQVDTSNYRHFQREWCGNEVVNSLTRGGGWISVVGADAGSRFRHRGGVFRRSRRHANAVRPWCQTKRVRL